MATIALAAVVVGAIELVVEVFVDEVVLNVLVALLVVVTFVLVLLTGVRTSLGVVEVVDAPRAVETANADSERSVKRTCFMVATNVGVDRVCFRAEGGLERLQSAGYGRGDRGRRGRSPAMSLPGLLMRMGVSRAQTVPVSR